VICTTAARASIARVSTVISRTHEFVMRSVSRAGDTYTDCVRFVHRTSLADTTVGSL